RIVFMYNHLAFGINESIGTELVKETISDLFAVSIIQCNLSTYKATSYITLSIITFLSCFVFAFIRPKETFKSISYAQCCLASFQTSFITFNQISTKFL